MKTVTSALTRLEEIAGRENVVGEPSQLAAYEVDGIIPQAAVRPASAEEIAEIVQLAVAEKLAIIVTGARTKLGIGAPPKRFDVALDVTRLDRVLAYDPGDLTLGVEPGISLCELQRQLAERRQFLPLAVPYARQTTVGGTIASGMDSPLRQAYGTARDFVLGMEFVTGEGVLSKSGGRVVKNVTGYDVHKLLIGSLGTLAVITRVNFRTFPLPPLSRGFLAGFRDLKGAMAMRRWIAKSPLAPVTLDLLSPELTNLFVRHAPRTDPGLSPVGPFFKPGGWTLAAGIAGNEQVVARHAAELTRTAHETGALEVHVLDDDSRPPVWGRLRECIPLMLDTSSAATILKIAALPSQTEDVLALAQRIAERSELRWAAVVRGVGTIYFALTPETSDPATLHSVTRAARELMSASVELKVGATIPWAPLELKGSAHVWGPPRPDAELMHRMKIVFDPKGIFAPGRFAGGI